LSYRRHIVAVGLAALATSNLNSETSRAASVAKTDGLEYPSRKSALGQAGGSKNNSNRREIIECDKSCAFDLNRRAVRAAEDSARWTRYGVYVGAGGIIFVVATLIAAIWQNILSRNVYLSSHRPRLRLRWIRTDEIEEGTPIKCKAVFVNIGDTAAKIIRIGADCTYIESEKIFGSPLNNYKEDASVNVKPGVQVEIDLVCFFKPTKSQIARILDGTAILIVNCVVIYKDRTGADRSTNIYRRYNPVIHMYERLPANLPHADQDFEA
jgi:hypothetical protein